MFNVRGNMNTLPIVKQISSLKGVYSPKFIAILEFVFAVEADDRIISPGISEMQITNGGTIMQYSWEGDVGMNGFESFQDFQSNVRDVLGYLEYTREEAQPVFERVELLRRNQLGLNRPIFA